MILDPIDFAYNLFTELAQDEISNDTSGKFNCQGMTLFEDTCDEVIAELKHLK